MIHKINKDTISQIINIIKSNIPNDAIINYKKLKTVLNNEEKLHTTLFELINNTNIWKTKTQWLSEYKQQREALKSTGKFLYLVSLPIRKNHKFAVLQNQTMLDKLNNVVNNDSCFMKINNESNALIFMKKDDLINLLNNYK